MADVPERILPSTIKPARDVPVRVYFQGEPIGTADVAADGTITITIDGKTFKGLL